MATKIKGKEAETEAETWDEIGIGDQVKHALWGVGTVLFRSGAGDASKAIVVFPEEGQKKLMLKYAKLKKVGSASKSEAAKLKAQAERAMAPAHAEPADDAPIGEDEEGLEPLPGIEDPDIFPDDESETFADRDDGGFQEFDNE